MTTITIIMTFRDFNAVQHLDIDFWQILVTASCNCIFGC